MCTLSGGEYLLVDCLVSSQSWHARLDAAGPVSLPVSRQDVTARSQLPMIVGERRERGGKGAAEEPTIRLLSYLEHQYRS